MLVSHLGIEKNKRNSIISCGWKPFSPFARYLFFIQSRCPAFEFGFFSGIFCSLQNNFFTGLTLGHLQKNHVYSLLTPQILWFFRGDLNVIYTILNVLYHIIYYFAIIFVNKYKEQLKLFQPITMKEFIIKKNDSGQRLDRFLQKAAPNLPKSMIYKALRKKNIKLNGKRADAAVMLSEGDVVACYLKDDFFDNSNESDKKTTHYSFLNVPYDINVIYEDTNILVVYKPMGLVVHDDDRNTEDTLIARVLHYLYASGSYSPDMENSFTPALCNRLDRNTSGLVIAAKNAEALREINRLIRENRIHKSYYCITAGKPPKKQDTVKAYHFKPAGSKIVKVSAKKLPGYRDMITKYNVLASNGRLSLLKIDLITGRTHQIRAHMSLIGVPLLGDDKYGLPEVNRQYNEKYQRLCAYKLKFEPEKDTLFSYLSGKRFTCNVPEFVTKYFPNFNDR